MAAGFGNIPPFFTNYGPATATSPGILTGPGVNQTVGGGTRTWVTSHTDGAAETLMVLRLDEDTTSKIEFVNLTPTNALFIPLVKGTQSGANVALGFRGLAGSDSGSTEVLYYDVSTTGLAAIATRPIAGWRNNNTTQMQLSAAGALSISGGTAPGLTVGGPIQLKSYTVATLPASPTAGKIAYASDAAGNGPCIAMGNGSVWKRCDNTSTTVA